MRRFYFDVLDGDTFSHDDEGLPLESLSVAEDQAIRAVTEMAHDSLPKRLSSEVSVRIRDDHGQTVLSVALSMTVRRMNPAHA